MRRTSSEVKEERELVAKIRHSLETNVAAVEKALLALYFRQTQDERQSETTREHNERGFAANDATVATRLVKNVIIRAARANVPPGRRLWGGSLLIGRRIALRYASTQLLEMAKQREAAKFANAAKDEADGRAASGRPL
jgi:hypothetical protein